MNLEKFIDMLRAAGYKQTDITPVGKQYRVSPSKRGTTVVLSPGEGSGGIVDFFFDSSGVYRRHASFQ